MSQYCSIIKPTHIITNKITKIIKNEVLIDKTYVLDIYVNVYDEKLINNYLQDLLYNKPITFSFDKNLIEMAIKKEESLRLSKETQDIFHQIEKGLIPKYRDWIDYVEELQKNIATEFYEKNMIKKEEINDFIKCIQYDKNEYSFWKKYNRASPGFNVIGQECPNVILKKNKNSYMLHDLLQKSNRTVLIASSYS